MMDADSVSHVTIKTNKEKVILHAALKAYATYGINETTTRQIAEIAGIGKSTIFEYFKTKNELLDASFHFLISGMNEVHREIHEIARQDPLAAMNRYLNNVIEISTDEPSTLLLISQYSLGILLKTNQFETTKSEYRKKMYPVMLELLDEFRFIISTGIDKDVFHPAAGLTLDGLLYTVCALIREIQAQAFLQDRDELSKTCSVIKESIFKLLGIMCTIQ